MWPQRYHCITESTECENWEKDRTGRRKERKTETEREAQQGGWNTITALWLVGCYNTPPTLAAILWAWPPRSPWSPDSLRPSWCRRVCAAPCTRSWWTPAGRRIPFGLAHASHTLCRRLGEDRGLGRLHETPHFSYTAIFDL